MLQAERDGARKDEENIFRIAEWDTIYVVKHLPIHVNISVPKVLLVKKLVHHQLQHVDCVMQVPIQQK